MPGLSSRSLSILVAAAALWRALNVPSGLWLVVVGTGPALLLIWFPEQVDDYTFGTWTRGGRIDAHTPPFLIAAAGWVLLLLCAAVLFHAPLAARVLGR
jgi:hypothetical protein